MLASFVKNSFRVVHNHGYRTRPRHTTARQCTPPRTRARASEHSCSGALATAQPTDRSVQSALERTFPSRRMILPTIYNSPPTHAAAHPAQPCAEVAIMIVAAARGPSRWQNPQRPGGPLGGPGKSPFTPFTALYGSTQRASAVCPWAAPSLATVSEGCFHRSLNLNLKPLQNAGAHTTSGSGCITTLVPVAL
jgi:hypothetical protein